MSGRPRIDELEGAELAVIETSGRVQTLVLETLVNCGSFWPALVGWAGAVLAMKKARSELKGSLSRMDYAVEITRLRHTENTNQCEIARLRAWIDRIFADASTMQTTIDQARELLENVNQGQDWYRRRDDWLRAHPVTSAATRADCNYVGRCNSSRCPKHGKEQGT